MASAVLGQLRRALVGAVRVANSWPHSFYLGWHPSSFFASRRRARSGQIRGLRAQERAEKAHADLSWAVSDPSLWSLHMLASAPILAAFETKAPYSHIS